MKKLVGVVLAGGKGTRLGEVTRVTNKHLLPVGNMPMIYYPIKKLIGINITDILIVSGTDHMGDFVELLGSGSRFKADFTYKVQDEAGGIAQALGLAERFCNGNNCVVILGDNIFYQDLSQLKDNIYKNKNNAHVVLKTVPDPSRYGVAYIKNNKIYDIVEKPDNPTSDLAVTGIYSYPPDVFDIIKTLKPSKRGELEITDVNKHYLHQNRLTPSFFNNYWTDAGTPDSLSLANHLVEKDPCCY